MEDFDFSEPKDDVGAQEYPSAISMPEKRSIREKKQRNKCTIVIFLCATLMALSIGISLGFYLTSRWGNQIFNGDDLTQNEDALFLTEVNLPKASAETSIEDVAHEVDIPPKASAEVVQEVDIVETFASRRQTARSKLIVLL